jgi:hypothetical protein
VAPQPDRLIGGIPRTRPCPGQPPPARPAAQRLMSRWVSTLHHASRNKGERPVWSHEAKLWAESAAQIRASSTQQNNRSRTDSQRIRRGRYAVLGLARKPTAARRQAAGDLTNVDNARTQFLTAESGRTRPGTPFMGRRLRLVVAGLRRTGIRQVDGLTLFAAGAWPARSSGRAAAVDGQEALSQLAGECRFGPVDWGRGCGAAPGSG